MGADRDLTAADRVVQLLRHLGIARAHFAMGEDVAAAHPEVVASLALVAPMSGATAALGVLAAGGTLAAPPLIVHGDSGPLSAAAPRLLAAYPGATAVVLRDYTCAIWSDVVADRRDAVGAALLDHLADAIRRDPIPPVRLTEEEGEAAGVTYRARGSGPPLLLFPLGLAPAQWEPIVPVLAERFCTITLGGAYLGVAALLEQRAVGGHGANADDLIDALGIPAGGSALEVGCGTGALTRRLARRVGPVGRAVGVDLNAYLLREAAALAHRDGLADRLLFREGNAEALPFPDASFDAALASTVLEEVDADRALTELVRVVRPGGRIAVAVRAAELPFWDSLALRPALRAKLDGRSNAGRSASGCADASLYRRWRALGLTDVTMGPRFVVDQAEACPPDWRALIDAGMLATLDADEAAEWRAAVALAEARESFLWGQIYHCAVGTCP